MLILTLNIKILMQEMHLLFKLRITLPMDYMLTMNIIMKYMKI